MRRPHPPLEEEQLYEEVESLLHLIADVSIVVEVSMWVVEQLQSREETRRGRGCKQH